MEMSNIPVPLAVPPIRRENRTRIWLERADSRSRMMHEGSLLVLAAAVLGLSFALPTLQSRHAWVNIPCLFKTITHLPCPACGLTRSFVQTAHGNIARAFDFHLLGPLLFGLTVAAGVYLTGSLATGYRLRLELTPRTRRIAVWSALGLFVICWIIKLAFMRGGW